MTVQVKRTTRVETRVSIEITFPCALPDLVDALDEIGEGYRITGMSEIMEQGRYGGVIGVRLVAISENAKLSEAKRGWEDELNAAWAITNQVHGAARELLNVLDRSSVNAPTRDAMKLCRLALAEVPDQPEEAA